MRPLFQSFLQVLLAAHQRVCPCVLCRHIPEHRLSVVGLCDGPRRRRGSSAPGA